MNHRISTFVLLGFALIFVMTTVIGDLISEEVDQLCDVPGSFLFKSTTGETLWGCGNVTVNGTGGGNFTSDQNVNTFNNVTFVDVNSSNSTILGNLTLKSILSCSEALETNAEGIVICGTDAVGGGAIAHQFEQWLNTTHNVTFIGLTILGPINTSAINSSDWTNVTITESQISDLVHTIDTNTINNYTTDQWANTTHNVTFDDITSIKNITGVSLHGNGSNITDIKIDCENVTGALSNLCSLVDSNGTVGGHFTTDQWVNTTHNVTFGNITSNGNVTVLGNITTTYLKSLFGFITPQNKLKLTLRDDGSEIYFNTTQATALNFEMDNTKSILFNNPIVTNNFKVFQIFSKEASDVTEFTITKAGLGHASYFVRSLEIGSSNYNCSQVATNIDCATDTTGADLWVQDDIEINGSLYINNESEKIQFANLTMDQNTTTIRILGGGKDICIGNCSS